MSVGSPGLMTAALLDSVGRFVGNVGVPAAIALFVLAQLTPRLDTIAVEVAQVQTSIQVETAVCAPMRSAPAIQVVPATP